ncbi:TetR/AcrR family transcriptional regulator [Demequina aestuarii]|uniref:TetR/AcrR family transcriptional regulator n=1 Tax=Demequina aestuarii TaxID=327095 RepID=UPI000AB87042|nr:TetR/AcrR family transcriptional regulator [Demequina aestuarii]
MATGTMRGQARAAILRAAVSEFTSHGIRAVSADRVMADAGVSKVTFYRHFPTKDDLVVAYLEAELDRVQRAVADAGEGATPGQWSAALAEEICRPGFRGCPFINAAAEYADPDHAVREVVARFRAWMIGAITAALVSRGVAEPERVARQVMMLRDGALVEGYVSGDPDRVAAELSAGVDALVAAA